MSATQTVATLFQLQQLDLELERLVAEQQAVIQALQGNRALHRLRKEQAIAQQQLQAGLQAQKEAEWALEELNLRLQSQEQRLYNGTVNNPKELYNLQQEVQRLRAQQSRQEEMALEVMDAADNLRELVERKEKALREAEAAWQQESADLVTRQDALNARRQELQGRRDGLAGSIDDALLKRYETMRRAKQGRAVSRVEQNSCQWCRVILTPSELQRARTSDELQTCSNCGRILYYDR